jgi:hypothetical protein
MILYVSRYYKSWQPLNLDTISFRNYLENVLENVYARKCQINKKNMDIQELE